MLGVHKPLNSDAQKDARRLVVRYAYKIANFITYLYWKSPWKSIALSATIGHEESDDKTLLKWVKKQNVTVEGLLEAVEEVRSGSFEANLGGYLIKKRIRFRGQGKSGSGRVIICYKQGNMAIFVTDFQKVKSQILALKSLLRLKNLPRFLLKCPQKLYL